MRVRIEAHKPTLQSCRDGWHKISVRKTQTPEVAHVSESAEKMSLSEGDGGHNPLPSPGYLRVKKQ